MANPTQAQIDKLTTNLSRYDSIINGAYNETVTLDSHTVKSISGYLSELTANTLRGLWATATSYAIKDIVEESGNWYVCLVAHTSGTFSSDLTANKWALYQINLSGNLDLSGDLNVSGTVAATTLTGTLSTAVQTNVTSLGTLSSLAVTGDLTVDTATLKVDSTNTRVGIGTSSPSHRFEVDNSSLNAGNVGTVCNIKAGGTTSAAVTVLNVQNSLYVNGAGKVFMTGLATSGTDNGTLKFNSATGEIWVD